MLKYLVILGAVVNMVGVGFYVRDILRGTTQPNRVSWFLWMVAPFIGTAAALMQGVTWAVIPVFMQGLGPLCVIIASYVSKHGYWKLGFVDYACGGLSILALILWWATKIPNIAIAFAIAADLLAALPTLLKSWTNPESESSVAFWVALFSSLTAFFALKMFTFSEIAFPIYLTFTNTLILIVLYRRKIKI